MTLAEYIQKVCADNDLQDTARFFLRKGDAAYHADRHVDEPPAGLGPEAACGAGFALLREWTREAASIVGTELFVSRPLLVIGEEWLRGLPHAARPSVLVTLARCAADLPPPEVAGAIPVSAAGSPHAALPAGEADGVTVFRIDASEERESLGAWVFRYDTAPEATPPVPRN